MSAAERAREAAAKTRAAIDGCHAILNDPEETPERKRKAREVLDRLVPVGDHAYRESAHAVLMQPGRSGRHRRGGDRAEADRIGYEGWSAR